MLDDYYERLENGYEQAHAAIYSATNRATEARRALESAEKQVDDAIALAGRIVSKMRRIEKS